MKKFEDDFSKDYYPEEGGGFLVTWVAIIILQMWFGLSLWFICKIT